MPSRAPNGTDEPRAGYASRLPVGGTPPGTLKAPPGAANTAIHLIEYGPEALKEHADCTVEQLRDRRGGMPVQWVHVTGLGDTDTLREIGEAFGLHGLALEDILDVHQRPKVEDYDEHLFVVTRMAVPGRPGRTSQLCLFLGEGFLLTFQEGADGWLDSVRQRLRQGRGRIRESAVDYLAYALLDVAMDSFFPPLEALGEALEDLEERALDEPGSEVFEAIHVAKRQLLGLRRSVWPMREMLSHLLQADVAQFSEHTRVYLRDCYDHAVQVIDLIETYREIAADLSDVYLASVSVRLNAIMKVLTVIATVFMPLSFITGVYGMNFRTDVSPWNMPELTWRYGYPAALLLMLLTAALLMVYFARKGWLSGRNERVGRADDETQ